jgi:hypothetical protein
MPRQRRRTRGGPVRPNLTPFCTRMLPNIWLHLNGQRYTNWLEQTVGEKSVIRDEYLAAVRAAEHGAYEAGVNRR